MSTTCGESAADAEPSPLRAVADTSYLLPFGVSNARQLLRELHPSAVLSPAAVRDELDGLAMTSDSLRRSAATALRSRGTAVTYCAVPEDHMGLREALLDELHAEAVAKGHAEGARDPTSRANLGEAECICLIEQSTEAMRCNDTAARRVAKRRGIPTMTTAEDLRRLVEAKKYTANQMAQWARRMSSLDIGDVVSGPAFFHRPRRQ